MSYFYTTPKIVAELTSENELDSNQVEYSTNADAQIQPTAHADRGKLPLRLTRCDLFSFNSVLKPNSIGE